MLMVSALRGVTLQERFAARAFVTPKRSAAGLHAITSKVGDLESVAARIIGPAAARHALLEYAAQTGAPPPKPAEPADRGLLQHFERVLAGSIGASSARVVLTHALKRKGLSLDEVAELLDETSQELRFSRQLLQATMENVTQGISVVDAEMRIVAWNRRYLESVRLSGRHGVRRPSGGGSDPLECRAGRARPRRSRGSMSRSGWRTCAPASAYTFQRARRNGQVYSIHGQPMSGGGFVTTYTDITEFKRHEQALLDAKQGSGGACRAAHAGVERTRSRHSAPPSSRPKPRTSSKTRFVAAASHDLLQPLNAARLFVSALESRARAHPELLELAVRIDASMRAAEELLE